MKDRLGDLACRQADVQPSVDMDLELRLRTTERRKRGDGDETKTGRGIRALIAEAQHDPSLAELLRDRFIASRRSEAATVFEPGIERGELRPDLDLGVAIDALYGAVYYRLLVSHAPLDPAYADTLIAQVFPAFEQRPSSE